MNSILQAITVLQEEIDAKNPERKKEREAQNKEKSFFSTLTKKIRGSSSKESENKKKRHRSSKSLSASTSPAPLPSIKKQPTFRRSITDGNLGVTRKGETFYYFRQDLK